MSEQAAPLGGRGGASFLDDARTTAFGCGVRSGDGAATHALPAAIALTPTPSDCDSAPAAQCNETKCGCNMSGFSVSLDFPASDSRVLDSVFASMRDACNARRPEQTLAFLIAHLQALQRTSAAPLSSPNSNPVSTLAPPQIRPSESAESQSKAQPPEPSAAAAINASSERESQPASASNKSPSGSSSKVSSSSASTSVPKSPASRPLRLERTPSNLPALQHFFGIDIGGSLCKIAFFEPDEGSGASGKVGDVNYNSRAEQTRRWVERDFIVGATKYGSTGTRDPLLSTRYRNQGSLHFLNFETRRIEGALDIMVQNGILVSAHATPPSPIPATASSAAPASTASSSTEQLSSSSSLPPLNLDGSSTESASAATSASTTSPSAKKSANARVTAHGSEPTGPLLMATGGGAYKYSALVRDRIGLQLHKKDELSCLLVGLNFLLDAEPDECFFLPDPRDPHVSATLPRNDGDAPLYPYLLVNIGSGVSILRVDGPDSYERVSGTCIGGGTFWGLCRLLTACRDFDEAMELSQTGDPSKCDMLVGDIYGGSYEKFGLSASIVASAFGKMIMKDAPRAADVTDADIARSLLNMVGHNIAQLAYMAATQHSAQRIMFCGNFLRHNRVSMGSLAFAIDYWSRGAMRALFLKHEGYFGALGALLLQGEPNEDEA